MPMVSATFPIICNKPKTRLGITLKVISTNSLWLCPLFYVHSMWYNKNKATIPNACGLLVYQWFLHIFLHLVVTYISTCHMLSNTYIPNFLLPHFEPRVNSFHDSQSDLPITVHIYRLDKYEMTSYIWKVEFWESLVNIISEFKYKLILMQKWSSQRSCGSLILHKS